MSASTCFEYGGYHFFPLRRFNKGEGDFFALSKRLERDFSLGLFDYKDRQKYPYSYDEFYKVATNPNYDIFAVLKTVKSMYRRRMSCLSITIRMITTSANKRS